MTVPDVIVLFLSGVMTTLFYEYTHWKKNVKKHPCKSGNSNKGSNPETSKLEGYRHIIHSH